MRQLAHHQLGTIHTCPRCGHKTRQQTRFCDQCGCALYEASKARAFALVEGTAGIGKTTLVDNMIRFQMRQNARLNTLVRLGQGHTYHPLAPDDPDSPFAAQDHLAYLERVYQTLSFLAHPGDSSTKPPFMCLIETLHLTLGVRPGLLSETQLHDFDGKLAAIGCKLILIKVTPQALWQRCIWERRKNGFITKYGRKYGSTLQEIHGYYVNEQQRMFELFEHSSMKKLLVNDDASPEVAAERAYRFWVS
jgi:hypothetical protein